MIKTENNPVISFLIIEWSLFEITWLPFTQGCSVLSLVEIGPVILEKMIFKFFQCFLLFRFISYGERAWSLIWIKRESPSSKNTLYQVGLTMEQCFRRWFLNFVNVFSFQFCQINYAFSLLSSLETGGALLISFSPKKICTTCKFGWNWHSGSCGKDFLHRVPCVKFGWN